MGKTPLSILHTLKPKVARVSHRVIFGLGLVTAAVLVFSLVAALAPPVKVSGQEKPANSQPHPAAPEPPDPIVSGASSYNELASTGSSRTRSRNTPAGDPASNNQTAPARGTATSPQEDATAKDREQRMKDVLSAINSPVGFNQADSSLQQLKPGQPAVNDTSVSLPGLAGLAERLANGTGVDDQNMQGEKRIFSGAKGVDFPYLTAIPVPPISPYEIKAGSILPAILITGINSDLPGKLVAQIRENVFDTVTGNYPLIPQGARLIGEYDSKIAFGQERALVVWTRLLFPNGDSLNLEGMPGADLSGYAGVTGKVNNHYGKLITGVILGSIIGAGAQVAAGGQGAPNVPPSFEQLAASGAAQNINQTAQQHIQRILNLQPTIEVSPGEKINVFVTKDMILKPYAE